MKINYNAFDDLCSSYFLNSLEEPGYNLLRKILDSGDEKARNIFYQHINSLLYLPDYVEQIEPPPDIKSKLLAKIKSGNNGIRVKLNDADYSKNFSFITSTEGEWVKHPVNGVYVKLLSVNKEKNYGVMIFRVDANTIFPPHHHSGAEECYVLTGDFYVGDKILKPGDFHHADENSDHGTLYTKNGCTLIIIASLDDYLPQ